MKPRTSALFAAAIAVLCGSALAVDVDVMTTNMYFGADVSAAVEAASGATDVATFYAAVDAAVEQLILSQPLERADAMATEIAARSPHVVCLQEAMYMVLDFNTGLPTTTDMLDELLDALDRAGTPYVAVAVLQNFSITLPGVTIDGVGTATLTFNDRDVILVRGDIATTATPVDLSDACTNLYGDGCHYVSTVEVTLPGSTTPLAVERGYLAVDLTIDGAAVRVYNTHIEVKNISTIPGLIQASQAKELCFSMGVLDASLDSDAIVILAGDLNSSPVDPDIAIGTMTLSPPYKALVNAGYVDAWTHTAPGFTCCQASTLDNAVSALSERIDIIFTAPGFRALETSDATLAGDDVADKTTPSGLWPSDHAMVIAALGFEDLGSVNGDPHFVGFNGAKFDFHGVPGAIFNLLSTPALQMNALLGPDLLNGLTYMSAVGISVGADRLKVAVIEGQLVAWVNDVRVTESASTPAIAVEFAGPDRLRVDTALLGVVVAAHKATYIDLESLALHERPGAIHGVLGQTAAEGAVPGAGYAGADADYYVGDLWGSDFAHNLFRAESRPATAVHHDAVVSKDVVIAAATAASVQQEE